MADSNNKFLIGSILVILGLLLLTQVILFNALSLGANLLETDKKSVLSTLPEVKGDIMPGEKIVNEVCKKCHAFGMMRAPKLGNERDWKKRVKKGKDVLYDHAINGFKRMPARGDRDLTDEQVKQAVDYMLSLLELESTQ